jgi:hypothetical protein
MTEPACRICYEDGTAEPLIAPCECKGSIEYSHKNCLRQWLVTARRDYCELCGTVYFSTELVLEPVYEPRDARILRLSRWTHLLFFLQILLYLLYLLYNPVIHPMPWDLEYKKFTPVQDGLISMGRAMPYMLLILAGLQMIVLVPAIRILNDKVRYFRYLMRPVGLKLNPILFLSVLLISFVMSFYLPVAGSIVYIQFISYLYDMHCHTVNRINAAVIEEFYSA